MIEKMSSQIEQKRKDIYDEREFLILLQLLRSLDLIDEAKYHSILQVVPTGDLKVIMEVIAKYEILTHWEWPFVWWFGMYFVVGDANLWREVFEVLSGWGNSVSTTWLWNYAMAIIPTVMLIRYSILKAVTSSRDLHGKETLCLAGANVFPTWLNSWSAFIYYYLRHKGIGLKEFFTPGVFLGCLKEMQLLYHTVRLYQKTRTEVSQLLQDTQNLATFQKIWDPSMTDESTPAGKFYKFAHPDKVLEASKMLQDQLYLSTLGFRQKVEAIFAKKS